MHFRRLCLGLTFLLLTVTAFGQQTGSITGKVTATDNSALPGVTVEASSNVLPTPRTTTTGANGEYRLPQLIPGNYTITFSLSGMQTVTRKATVILGTNTSADAKLGVQGVTESITVTAESSLVDKSSTALQSGLSQEQIQTLPLVQNYGDLQKLVPGVQYTQDTVRGPSAGASGQENVYLFDGANVTMPLFGVLLSQPNINDIAQVNITRGAANAIDFNRAGGFQIDSVSKSGTNKFTGSLAYQTQRPNFVADQVGAQNLSFQNTKSWTTVNAGGPIMANKLFFYGSYYRPYAERGNPANLYGPLPDYTNEHNEYFGKLTFTPTDTWLFNGSYRNAHEIETSKTAFTQRTAPTAGTGYESRTKLANLEGSKIINSKSFATFKLTKWDQPGFGRADILSSAVPSVTPGAQLDLANIATLGNVTIPTLIGGNTAQNAFVQPYITKYGYPCPAGSTTCTPGQPTTALGTGIVGYGTNARDNDSFGRTSGQVAYNATVGAEVTHDVHVGYQRYQEHEDLDRASNGWGSITIPAGVGAAGTCPATACGTATPAFFVANFAAQGVGKLPIIHSEYHSQSVEFNDVVHVNNWAVNLGFLTSQDTIYGQGLAKANNVAGFVKSPGTKYKMHSFSWGDLFQPRIGATWSYNGRDTVFASLARYNPPVNSDARAASWDRGLVQQVNTYFDATGKLIGVDPVGSSAGKWWQEGIKPPEYKELVIGTARQINSAWSAKVYGRAKKGDHYIEDTNNNARVAFNPPPGIPRELYVPNLGDINNAIQGSPTATSYVIANLDGAFTKYLEATGEADWRGNKMTLHGTYTWSHYYGNFDQDYSSTSTSGVNDAALFVGSSNLGDAAGRQIWNFKYGKLRGDRPIIAKIYGTYFLPWNATTGFFALAQSGQVYQIQSALAYRDLTTSTSDTNRLAEPAGSRRSPFQTNLDLNYTQSFGLIRGTNLQLAVDLFNVLNRQTGYNFSDRTPTDLGIVCVATSSKCTNLYTGKTIAVPNSIPDSALKNQVAGGADFARSQYAIVAPAATSFLNPRRFQVTARITF
jgi:hypothetical protein